MSDKNTVLPRDSEQTPKPPAGWVKAPNDAAEEPKKRLELSFTQVLGGALAAMTAAGLGSTLGVAGTIIGAAFASVVAGVAGAVYTASLKTGHAKVRTVFRAGGARAQPAVPEPVPSDPVTDHTIVLPALSDHTTVIPAVTGQAPRTGGSTSTSPRRTRFSWKHAVGVAVTVFVLAGLVLTGYELVTGRALSGGSGTTVSQVREETGNTNTDPTTAPSESSASPTPSVPTSASPTAEPSPSAPSSAPTSPEPSTAPSTQPTPTTPTPAPSSGAGG